MRLFKTPILFQKFFTGILWRIPNPNQTLFLSFDDGPIPEVTPWVLEVLKVHSAKATFFCVGDNVRKYPDIKSRILQEGHSLGNHTYHHLDAWKNNPEKYLEDIEQCSLLVESRLFRPPYGHLNIRTYRALKNRYKIVYWDLISYDFDPGMSPEYCLEVLKTHTKSGSILVFHDSIKSFTLLQKVLPPFLEYCEKRGYRFESIPA
jgi:peptidoglycan/xylan/chitin deacetylase (PgdA/CDA1 family)